jgi:EAL domain-containing protein (putative c-di-GMP-specific phosphodiesterase class I)
MRKNLWGCASAVLVTVLAFSIFGSVAVAALDLMVGYYDYDGYLAVDEEGHITGYAGELLDMLVEANPHWNFVPIELERAAFNESMRKGFAVLSLQSPYTEASPRYFVYSEYPIGFERGIFYTGIDQGIYFEDFAFFEGMRVGAIANDLQTVLFDEYQATNGFSVEYTLFENLVDMRRALASKEIDGIIYGSMVEQADLKIVARYSEVPLHVAGNEWGASFVAYFDRVIGAAMQENPYFLDGLYAKYYDDAPRAVQAMTEEEEAAANLAKIAAEEAAAKAAAEEEAARLAQEEALKAAAAAEAMEAAAESAEAAEGGIWIDPDLQRKLTQAGFIIVVLLLAVILYGTLIRNKNLKAAKAAKAVGSANPASTAAAATAATAAGAVSVAGAAKSAKAPSAAYAASAANAANAPASGKAGKTSKKRKAKDIRRAEALREQEEKAQALENARIAAEAEAQALEEARVMAEAQAKAEEEARAKAEEDALTKAKAEEDARIRLLEEATIRAQEIARYKAEEEIRMKNEENRRQNRSPGTALADGFRDTAPPEEAGRINDVMNIVSLPGRFDVIADADWEQEDVSSAPEYTDDQIRGEIYLSGLTFSLQPRYSVNQCSIVGAEVSISCRHPIRDRVYPEELVQSLTQKGKLHILDRYIFESLCLYKPHEKVGSFDAFEIVIPVFAESVLRPDFSQWYIEAATRYQIPLHSFRLDLVYRWQADQDQHVYNALKELTDAGFKVALKDVGIANYPLDLLSEVDLEAIVVSEQLIMDALGSERKRRLLAAIKGLCTQMEFRMEADRIDSREKLQMCTKVGCQVFQGNFLTRAIPFEQFWDFTSKLQTRIVS